MKTQARTAGLAPRVRNASRRKRLAPAGYWLRESIREVQRDVAEIKAGRPGSMRSYSVDELLKELHA